MLLRRIRFKILKFFFCLLQIFSLTRDRINALYFRNNNILSFLNKKYLNWFLTFSTAISDFSFYKHLSTKYVAFIKNPFFIFGRFIFAGYYTADMIGRPYIWYYTIYRWKPANTPLAFNRPLLPMISVTKYGFHVPHVPFQFMHMLDASTKLIILIKYWYMPRELERLTAQRYWRDYWHVHRNFCKFLNIKKKSKKLRRKALRFYLFTCTPPSVLRGTYISILKVSKNHLNIFEHFLIIFFKIYKKKLFLLFPKFKNFFLLYFSKGLLNSLLKFNTFSLINFIPFFHKKYKSFKNFYEKFYLFPSIYLINNFIFIHLELFLSGLKLVGLNPGVFSYYFFFYRTVDIYSKNFKVLKLKFFSIRVDMYTMYLCWSYVAGLRLFKYREYLMYIYAINFFPIFRRYLVPAYLVYNKKHLKRHFAMFQVFYYSLKLKKFRIYYSKRLVNYPLMTIYYDIFSKFFTSCGSSYLLSKIQHFSTFYTPSISRLYRQHFILHCHLNWQIISLKLMYKYRLFKFLYYNYMEFYVFLRHFHYPYLFCREYMPSFMRTYLKKFMYDLYVPLKKMHFFLDLKTNLYKKKKKFTLDSLTLNSDLFFVLSTRRVYITLKSVISTTLFLNNFKYFTLYSWYFHKMSDFLYHVIFDNIFLFIFSIIDKNAMILSDLHRFYYTIDILIWRFFSFDPMITILRKELKNIYIFRKLDIDLILYSRYRVYWDLILFSWNRNSLSFKMRYIDLHFNSWPRRIKDFFTFNTFNKIDLFFSFILKFLNRSFEFPLILFLLFKRQYLYLFFYFFKFFTFKSLRSILFSFQARPLIKLKLNKGLRVLGIEPFLKCVYREDATIYGIFNKTYTNKFSWIFFRIKYYLDKPIRW